MTPKEKAEELVDKYFKLLNYEFGDLVYSLRDKQPHECASVAVDEILNNDNNLMNTYSQNDYWLQVKQEIAKL